MLLSQGLTRIAGKLNQLRHADRTLSIFGSRSHRYRLGPTLSVSALAEYEERLGVQLPIEYWLFLIRIGLGWPKPVLRTLVAGGSRLGASCRSVVADGRRLGFLDWYEKLLDGGGARTESEPRGACKGLSVALNFLAVLAACALESENNPVGRSGSNLSALCAA
jgi:hypothetical protein